jgi:hypothetical protein
VPLTSSFTHFILQELIDNLTLLSETLNWTHCIVNLLGIIQFCIMFMQNETKMYVKYNSISKRISLQIATCFDSHWITSDIRPKSWKLSSSSSPFPYTALRNCCDIKGFYMCLMMMMMMMIQCELKHFSYIKWYSFWNSLVFDWCVLLLFRVYTE